MRNKVTELFVEVVDEDQSGMFADILSKPSARGEATIFPHQKDNYSKIDGVVIGKIVTIDQVSVDYCGNPSGKPVPATTTKTLSKSDMGCEAALLFENGDPLRPIIVGLIQDRSHHYRSSRGQEEDEARPPQVQLDGERLTFTADKEIVLKCGDASITMTRAGKIILRGAYIISRSTGVNRIKGGSVQIN